MSSIINSNDKITNINNKMINYRNLNKNKLHNSNEIIKSEEFINVCYIGAGYVGGTSGAVMAYKCPEDRVKVTICDTCQEKIKEWNSDKLPINEPGLDNIVKYARGVNLFFTTDIEKSIKNANIIFISVGTPIKQYGFGSGEAAELSCVERAVQIIAKFSYNSKIIVEKSTIPCKTAEYIESILNSNIIKCSNNKKEKIHYLVPAVILHLIMNF